MKTKKIPCINEIIWYLYFSLWLIHLVQPSLIPSTLLQMALFHPFRGCCCSVAQLCFTLCDPGDYSMPGFLVLHHLPELAQIHVHWVSDANYPSHPLLIPSPFAFSLSQNQGLFQCISSSNQVAKVSISPSKGYSWLISFRIDWFDLLAVQGTLKNLLQHYNSKTSILQCSAFFMV